MGEMVFERFESHFLDSFDVILGSTSLLVVKLLDEAFQNIGRWNFYDARTDALQSNSSPNARYKAMARVVLPRPPNPTMARNLG
jgi:hypothetical protein